MTSASGDSVSSGDESSVAPTELMITTRERRRTAGNRYSQVVAQEQVDEDEEDDVALLFAEAEGEDEEYNSDEADDEADMSSSDDDDQGPNAGADELEGEQELEKQAKVERQKKRKADMALTTLNGIRKKPKIDPTSLHRAPDKPKPSKRKERVSWLPVTSAAPGRTSLRKQTVAHREVLLERLKENEEQRLKTKAQREKKEKLKQAEAPKELTQVDRLAEAARNERRNAKSLNRWEAKEKERAEEQAARLAALKERKLNGPVLTTYSAAHVYYGLRAENESPAPAGTDETPVRRKWQRKPKPPIISNPQAEPPTILPPRLNVNETLIAMTGSGVTTPISVHETTTPQSSGATQPDPGLLAGIHEHAMVKSASGSQDGQPDKPGPEQPQVFKAKDAVATTPQSSEPLASNIHNATAHDKPRPKSAHTDQPGARIEPSKRPDQQVDVQQGYPLNVDDAFVATSVSNVDQTIRPKNEDVESLQTARTVVDTLPEVIQAPVVNAETSKEPQPPKIEVLSTRNLVILDKIDELNLRERRDLAVLFNQKKAGKPSKPATEYCAITGRIARYRDPSSGVGYANLLAYKKLKEAQKHQFCWSSMLGCYVGRIGTAARGVPEGFLG